MQEPRSGDRLGSFQLVEELGRGGMGIVFRARDLSLDRDVALKLLMPGLATEQKLVQRFHREARIVAALNHPHIVSVLSSGEQNGTHFFVMEYVAGRDLGRILEERSRLPADEALRITAQIASALDQASARGIVHRDIKPSNILVDESGMAWVTDFGIARFADAQGQLTTTGEFLGSVEYASPEQARGDAVDVRSDIYSLGALLYRMLGGQPSASGGSPVAVLVKIATERPVPLRQLDPSLPAPLCELVERMMEMDVNRRLQTPGGVLAAIQSIENTLGGATTGAITDTLPVQYTAPAPARATAPPARHRSPWPVRVGTALGALAAVVILVTAVESGVEQRDSFEPSEAPTSIVQGPPNEAPSGYSTDPPTIIPVQPQPPSASEAPRTPVPLTPPTPQVAAAPPAGPAAVPSLPTRPNVLVLVSGDESMVPAVRAQLESLFQRRGLRLVSAARYPVLREKLQAGRLSLYWYDVVQLLPANTAQILVLAEIRKTGSTTLRYYGRRDEMTLASFTLQTVDATTGASIHSASAPSIEFTALNMGQNLNQAIEPVVAGIDTKIEAYWKRRLEHDSS